METDWGSILEPVRRGLVTRPGCSAAELGDAENALGVALPPALVGLLRYSNGLFDTDAQYWAVWTLAETGKRNPERWSDEALQLPGTLLGFGDDGAGGWFCLLTDASDGRVHHLAWIEGTPRVIAPDLASFLPRWLGGDLKV